MFCSPISQGNANAHQEPGETRRGMRTKPDWKGLSDCLQNQTGPRPEVTRTDRGLSWWLKPQRAARPPGKEWHHGAAGRQEAPGRPGNGVPGVPGRLLAPAGQEGVEWISGAVKMNLKLLRHVGREPMIFFFITKNQVASIGIV